MTPDDMGHQIARGFAAGLGNQDTEVMRAMDRITENMIGAHLKPSVGRIVHYVSHGTPVKADGSQAFTSECRAAIVTEVGESGEVGLCVLSPTGQFFNRGVPFQDARGLLYEGDPAVPVQRTGGTWHWPERVE